jgi:hypothetical protein
MSATTTTNARPAEASGTFLIGDIPVRRLGFGKENASALIKALEKEADVEVKARSREVPNGPSSRGDSLQ